MKLTENFRAGEVWDSDTAATHGVDNTPSTSVMIRATALAVAVLQPLRFELGIAVDVTSWYRCKQLNEMVDGSVTSQHLTGEAADIYAGPYTPEALARVLHMMRLPVDQVIVYPARGIVHVSHNRLCKNRNEWFLSRGGNLVPWVP